MIDRKFCSKILLFGEYSIIQGSMGLAIPFNEYYGKWIFQEEQRDDESSNILKSYLTYLKDLKDHYLKEGNIHHWFMDIERFEKDLERGLYFNSTIPQGYGLGSSGALCAALYATYSQDSSNAGIIQINLENSNEKLDNNNHNHNHNHNHKSTISDTQKNYLNLMDKLGQLESFFHGKSSGMDPLISYLNSPILFKGKDSIGPINIPNISLHDSTFFLVQTGRSRKTGPLVKLFLHLCNQKQYLEKLESKLIPLTHNCIEYFLSGMLDKLYQSFRELSAFQLQYFADFIPEELHLSWQKGLEKNLFSLKLCGAGGGGVLLGLTKNLERTKEFFPPNRVIPIYPFQHTSFGNN